MYFLITESPAKAKKIQGFLSNEYEVKSSCGHNTDLEKKKLSIDVDNNFKPTYKIMSDKKEIVKMLKENSKGKNIIFRCYSSNLFYWINSSKFIIYIHYRN